MVGALCDRYVRQRVGSCGFSLSQQIQLPKPLHQLVPTGNCQGRLHLYSDAPNTYRPPEKRIPSGRPRFLVFCAHRGATLAERFHLPAATGSESFAVPKPRVQLGYGKNSNNARLCYPSTIAELLKDGYAPEVVELTEHARSLDLRATRIAPLLDLPFAFALFAGAIPMLLGLMLVRFAQKASRSCRLRLASLVMHQDRWWAAMLFTPRPCYLKS